MNTFFISSPLEQFEVFEFIGLHSMFGLNLALTNLGLYASLVVVVLIALHLLSVNSQRIVPSRWSIGLESAHASLHSMVKESIGSANEQYLPFIYSMFFFVLFGNLFGNIPYSFAITSSVMVCMGLSVTIFLGVTILAIVKHGWKFATFFLPAGTPTLLIPLLVVIELVSYVSRAFSLGIRLFANIVAGHALLNILSGMIYKIMCSGVIAAVLSVVPLVIFIALVGLELAVSLIQAFVWVTLVSSYIHDAEYLH